MRSARGSQLASIGSPLLARARLVVASLAVVSLAFATAALAAVGPPAPSGNADEPVGSPPGEPGALVLAADADDDEEAAEAAPIDAPILRSVPLVLTRDPFESVRPEPPPSEEINGPPAPTPPTDPTDPSSPGTGPQPPPVGNGTSQDRCVEQGELVCDGRVVTVQSTTSDSAVVRIGDTTYDVTVGQTVADNVTLTDIDASGCAILRFGDQLVRACPGSPGTLK